jgi:hypothetical protein
MTGVLAALKIRWNSASDSGSANRGVERDHLSPKADCGEIRAQQHVIHDAVQLLRRQNEGVSTGQQQVIHFGMAPDVCADARVLRRRFIGCPADNSLTKTIPAV